MTRLREFTGGNTTARNKLNEMVRVLNDLQNIQGDGYIKAAHLPGGVGLSLSLNRLLPRIPHSPRKIPAKLTDETTGSYSWVEVRLDDSGDWEIFDDNRSGLKSTTTAAEEKSGAIGVPDDTIVWIWREVETDGGVTYRFEQPAFNHQLFACLVWRDGGTTDGDDTNECDRTYNCRTLEATGPAAGGVSLGTGLSPKRRRWVTNHFGAYEVPSTTGAGVVGLGYYDDDGAFALYDANETASTAAC